MKKLTKNLIAFALMISLTVNVGQGIGLGIGIGNGNGGEDPPRYGDGRDNKDDPGIGYKY